MLSSPLQKKGIVDTEKIAHVTLKEESGVVSRASSFSETTSDLPRHFPVALLAFHWHQQSQ